MEPTAPERSHDDTPSVDRKCPVCGERSVTTYWYHDTFTYGSGDTAATIEADLPVRRCGACDFEFLDHEGQRLQHEAVCRHLRVLTPTEIRAIREISGMTRAEFAELTGLGEATLNRWENGAVVQNRANDCYLRLLAHTNVVKELRGIIARRDEIARRNVSNKPYRSLTVTDHRLRAQESFALCT